MSARRQPKPKSGPGARGGPKPLLCFRVADVERERWRRVAAGMGLGLSAWLRMVATQAAGAAERDDPRKAVPPHRKAAPLTQLQVQLEDALNRRR